MSNAQQDAYKIKEAIETLKVNNKYEVSFEHLDPAFATVGEQLSWFASLPGKGICYAVDVSRKMYVFIPPEPKQSITASPSILRRKIKEVITDYSKWKVIKVWEIKDEGPDGLDESRHTLRIELTARKKKIKK